MKPDSIISTAMSQLGKISAEKRKKANPDYWKEIRLKGAEARKKNKEIASK